MNNRLLKIKYNSPTILILLVQPVYALWLLSIGNFAARQLKRNDTLNKISTITMAVIWTSVIIMSQIKSLRHTVLFDFSFEILFPFSFVCWIYSIIFVAKATVDYENMDKDYMTSMRDYLPRFFLIYCIIGVWFVQKTINETYKLE